MIRSGGQFGTVKAVKDVCGRFLLLFSGIASVARPLSDQEVFRKDLGAYSARVLNTSTGFTLELTTIGTGSTKVLTLPSMTGSVDYIQMAGRRILVSGPAQHVTMVHVVDPQAGNVVDTFLCDDCRVSPDGRYVAFVAVLPKTSDDSAVYLVYDLEKTASENRMTQATDDFTRAQQAGTAVFPEWNRLSRSYKPQSEPATQDHDRRSPLVWLDPTTLVFLDYCAERIDVVLISIRGGLANPEVRVRELDAKAIVDESKIGAGVAPDFMVRASDIVPISSTPTTWTFELVLQGGAYLKEWTLDVMM